MTTTVTNKDGIDFDIDALATDVNGKADVDLTNIAPSSSAKSTIIGWVMPDYSAGVSKAWDTALQAEVDGWIEVAGGTNNAGYASYHLYISKNGTDFVSTMASLYTNTQYGNDIKIVPIPKNYYYKADGGSNSHSLIFYPCKGEN